MSRALTIPGPTEKQFLAQVVQVAKLFGWLAYHTHDSRRSAFGFPDLVLLRGRELIVAELKVGRGKLTPEQQAWLGAFALVPGVRAVVWRPEDWPSIEAALRQQEAT